MSNSSLPLPLCFDSREQYVEWRRAARAELVARIEAAKSEGLLKPRRNSVKVSYPGIRSYRPATICDDCTKCYRKEMQSQGRCTATAIDIAIMDLNQSIELEAEQNDTRRTSEREGKAGTRRLRRPSLRTLARAQWNGRTGTGLQRDPEREGDLDRDEGAGEDSDTEAMGDDW